MVRDICRVVACSNGAGVDRPLHLMPKNKSTTRYWLSFLEIANEEYELWVPVKKMHVCSQHFQKEDLRVGPTGRAFVLTDRFPTLISGKDLRRDILERVSKQMHTERAKEVTTSITLDLSSREPEESCSLHGIIDKEQPQNKTASLENLMAEKDKVINKMKTQISQLLGKMRNMQEEIRVLKQRCGRQEESRKRKAHTIQDMKIEMKRSRIHSHSQKKHIAVQTEFITNEESRLESLFVELLRKKKKLIQKYPDSIREFAFNMHYLSPRAYAYLRESLEDTLPHPVQMMRWTKHTIVSPGLIPASLNFIKESCDTSPYPKYYALACDEMPIRQQLLFNGNKMVGCEDYGSFCKTTSSETAKSAFCCMAIEINGRKAIPIAYVLTNGLKADVMAKIISKCLQGISDSGGRPLSITFDGLRANFLAMTVLGACLDIESPNFQPYIIHPTTQEKVHIIPDPSHMFKLMRNTFAKKRNLFDKDENKIQWSYIEQLHALQLESGLKASNKLTTRHVKFENQKMKTKLCAQVLSNSVAVALDVCRKIDIPGFENSMGTATFLRKADELFDVLNSRTKGTGLKAPLQVSNILQWEKYCTKTIEYLQKLKIAEQMQLVPLHKTKNGTFVKGLIIALSSLRNLMRELECSFVKLKYIPTYKLGQDLLELFFGKVRSRLGANNNPNVEQFKYALKSILCFSIAPVHNGNCVPLDDTSNKVSLTSRLTTLMFEENEGHCNDDAPIDVESEDFLPDLEGIDELGGFVENVVVYIAGFVGRRLAKTMKCASCIATLMPSELEDLTWRSDFVLLNEKTRGGLFYPSGDLIAVCKIVERFVRIQQSGDISAFNMKDIQTGVQRECLRTKLFVDIHADLIDGALSHNYFEIVGKHRVMIISEITKCYASVRFHHLARSKSLDMPRQTNRNLLTKLVHFSGN